MNTSLFRFTFKPAVESQRELIHQWLQQDYINEWIHGQGLQNTLSGLEKFFQYQAKDKGLDRQAEITQHWIGYDGDKPFVYLLTSNVFKNTADAYAKYSELDGLAITLDIFIGDTNYLGKGLASTVIKEFLLSQFSDVSEVFIDPEKDNVRATHVYQKVGDISRLYSEKSICDHEKEALWWFAGDFGGLDFVWSCALCGWDKIYDVGYGVGYWVWMGVCEH